MEPEFILFMGKAMYLSRHHTFQSKRGTNLLDQTNINYYCEKKGKKKPSLITVFLLVKIDKIVTEKI